jgi:hypothetical protein
MLLAPRSDFSLAVQLDREGGAPIGEVFSFMSGLYFRGKLEYSRAFAQPAADAPPILVITTDRGLIPPETPITRADIEAFATVDLARSDERFHGPLVRDATALSASLGTDAMAVLLGSIASEKYVNPLLAVFGERLVFPSEFVGRGDMSRGGLLVRRASDGVELAYEPVAGAVRHGKRPPKLEPLRASRQVNRPRRSEP